MIFSDECYEIRAQLKPIAEAIKTRTRQAWGNLEGHPKGVQPDNGEMIANLMLAYRHIEDAIMRIGKAVQAFDGGTSVYPK